MVHRGESHITCYQFPTLQSKEDIIDVWLNYFLPNYKGFIGIENFYFIYYQ